MTATIPEVERKTSREPGERFEPVPAGTVTRAVTILCEPQQARDMWRQLASRWDAEMEATFSEAPADRGTIVTVTIPDTAPRTALGSAAATLKKDNPADAVADALRHLKALVETGEIPTIEGQPSGRRS